MCRRTSTGRLVALEATMVCYASNRLASVVLQALLDHGAAPDRTAAMIYHGTQPSQATTTGTLTQLVAHTSAAAQADAGILVISEVVNLRNHLRWFDERPLGKRIVVTRSRARRANWWMPWRTLALRRSKPRPSDRRRPRIGGRNGRPYRWIKRRGSSSSRQRRHPLSARWHGSA
jgi:hypothetical protein